MKTGEGERPTYFVEIFLVSFAALLLEISYTRLISFKLFYYYTYLIIGLALLGMGAGGVLTATSARLRAKETSRLLFGSAFLAALSVGLGYFVVALTPLNAITLTTDLSELPKLLLVCGALFSTYLAIGVVIAVLFSRNTGAIDRLYFFDLLGAGLACAMVVPLISVLSPPACIMLSGALLGAVSLRLALRRQRAVIAAAALLTAALLMGAGFPDTLPEPLPDEMKTMHPDRLQRPVLYSSWSPVFRIDVTPADGTRLIHHDGLWGSSLHAFNGDLATLSEFDSDLRLFPFQTLEAPRQRVLIIGSAGGHEILASLYFGAESITAVELNPITVSLLTTVFPDYTGHIAEHPKVTLINDEGRSFMARDDEEYDLIFFVAPDSYSAMNSATAGAFVLTESYLYTVEMIVESLEHLSDDGIICMQFGEINYPQQPNRTARYVGTAKEAFRRLGIPGFEKHVLVATSPHFFQVSTVLIKKSPFSEGDVDRFLGAMRKVEGSRVRHAWGRRFDNGAVNHVIDLEGAELERWYASQSDDVTPITDDSPFFWHFARFKNVLAQLDRNLGELNVEDSIGERLLLVMLAVSTLFAALFLLIPFVGMRETWRSLPLKGRSALYFGALGLGFMFYEICLIQKLTLFLGYPTYSLTVTLMSILVSTGIGSLLTRYYAQRRNEALLLLLGGLVILTLFYQLGMDPVMNTLLGAPLAIRIAVSMVMITPLGLCLGAFMPLGLSTLSRLTTHSQEYVAWGWALNGFFSVIGSVLTTMLSMTLGFKLVLLLGLGAYTVAVVAMRGIPDPVPGRAVDSTP